MLDAGRQSWPQLELQAQSIEVSYVREFLDLPEDTSGPPRNLDLPRR